MNDDEIQFEYYEYVSPYNVLVVSSDGEIFELNCPFEVKAKVNFPDIKANDLVWVHKVQTTNENKDVFIIGEEAYSVKYFHVIV
ncbi:hypothetical protein SLH46_06315 [Draconibacterium sp. IB214405]|uniref:hypothetical protein n=1 Tax=Draconibacterium sp. IB214405 TaxID=3097352 RepID=UPI002A0CE653|nr:hypothetical protein [Draconibacterium sp. IB214405]MDX8338786.1 hypothetical protein [Draconibacterium sp. IB214405]